MVVFAYFANNRTKKRNKGICLTTYGICLTVDNEKLSVDRIILLIQTQPKSMGRTLLAFLFVFG